MFELIKKLTLMSFYKSKLKTLQITMLFDYVECHFFGTLSFVYVISNLLVKLTVFYDDALSETIIAIFFENRLYMRKPLSSSVTLNIQFVFDVFPKTVLKNVV